jgi:hypothetical protein
MHCEVHHGLRWDPDKEVWTGEDGFVYDKPPLCYTNLTSPLT